MRTVILKLEPAETRTVMVENKMNAQIFILNVYSELLRNQNCQRASNMGVFVQFSVAVIRVLKKKRGCKYFSTYLIFRLAKLLCILNFEKKMCWERTKFRY